MGMYTELYVAIQIKKECPSDVLNILRHMFSGAEIPTSLPEHEFFKCLRWNCIGNCSSFYFVPISMSRMEECGTTGRYVIISRSDLKNYDGEIRKFLDWINPHIYASHGDHLGHLRYEEDEKPTLLFYGE